MGLHYSINNQRMQPHYILYILEVGLMDKVSNRI